MLLFFAISIVEASSSINIDNYGGQVPKPFEEGSVVFTTPALQNMQRTHISKEQVLAIIKSHPNQDSITEGKLNLFLKDDQLGHKRLIGLWQEY